MVAVCQSAVVSLNERHKILDQIATEEVATHTHTKAKTTLGSGQQLRGIAVGQHHYHLLGSTFGYEVVQDMVDASHLEVHLFGVGRSADEIHHGIFLRGVLVVGRWSIDDGIGLNAKCFRGIGSIFHATMRHVLHLVYQTIVGRVHLQQTVLETLVREPIRVVGIHYLIAIHHEAVGIDVSLGRTEGQRPDTPFALLHFVTTGKLYIHLNLLGIGILIGEGHCVVSIDHWGSSASTHATHSSGLSLQSKGEAQRTNENR